MVWKASQTSSGYFLKIEGKPAEYLRLAQHEHGNGNKYWEVAHRKGFNADYKNLGEFPSLDLAKKFMKGWMKSHPKGC